MAAIDTATTKIRELYDEEIRRAAQPQQRPQVVRMFVELSTDDSLTAAQSWAMLHLAVEIAEQDDDLRLFDEALRAFAAAFPTIDSDGRMLGYLAERENQMPRLSGDHVINALNVNERLRLAERFDEATAATALAERMLRKVDAATAAGFRERIEEAQAATRTEAELAAAASAGRDALASDPADVAANLNAGLYAAVRGDWVRACLHLRKCGRADLQQAAEAESEAGEEPRAMCSAADCWWRITPDEATPEAEVDASGRQSLPEIVRRGIRLHAADIYERALARGLDDLLSRKEAQKRIDAVRGTGRPSARPGVPPMPDFDPLPVVFNADTFGRLERERTNAWRRFTAAARNGDRNAYAAAVRSLTRIRPEWCGAVGLAIRDDSLGQRQDAIRQVVLQDQQCSDTQLCQTYLHMLAGDKEDAKRSFVVAYNLVTNDPAGQVFCARQLLDMAWAALLVGDLSAAQHINNQVLQKRFPNDPSVLQVQASMWTAQKRPRFADAIEKLKVAYDKTDGEDRAAVAANLAWLRAATPLDTNLRMPDEAETMADEAIRVLRGRSWQAWRAKAELRASEKNWDAALAMLARAESQAPLIHEEELARQRARYLEKQSYELERK